MMAKSRVIVEFPDRPAYDVRIGTGVAVQLGSDVRGLAAQASSCLVVCDAESSSRCLPALRDALAGAGFRVSDIAIPAVDPDDAWACMGELLGAVAQLGLEEGSPVVVCAGVEASQLAAFAFSLDASARPLVLVPASLAAAMSLAGVEAFEADAGFSAPLRVKAAPAFACIDPAVIACASGEEADLGLYELEQAAVYCDGEFGRWLSDALGDIVLGDEDALVLAITQVLAARADAIGRSIRLR